MTDTAPSAPSAQQHSVGAGRGRAHPGPPLVAAAIATTATLVLGAFSGPLGGYGTIPPPSASAATVRDYVATAHTTITAGSWLVGLSALALLVFSAVAYSRLAFLAPNAPGAVIAGFGGVVAAVLLGTSAGATWVMSRTNLIDSSTTLAAAHDLAFVTGGPLHVVALGVLLIGMSVTLLFVRRTPRLLSVVGLVLAGVDVLASTALLTDATTALVPIGRFATLLWLIVAAVLIPRERAARGRG